ncbi:hypothetical protein AWB76_07880 [Caballeronia temeraria]|uniref:Uncharacterized protein n=1 Tax=Caballeronia temeraria TaxID=1777137 RepID=A0A158E1S9_9BURK|nr:hypothetical protein AWB76_07880 [Caballeronia temeraria]
MSRPRDDHGFAHGRMIDELRLDLAKLDTEATNLDLMIVAAEELDVAVGAITGEVARAIHARAGNEGIIEETLGSEFGPVQIAARDAFATDVKLTHRTKRHVLALRIEQINAGIGDRLADGLRQTIVPVHLNPCRVRRRLGWAVQIAQPIDRGLGEDALHQRELQRFAGEVDRPDRCQRCARIQQ